MTECDHTDDDMAEDFLDHCPLCRKADNERLRGLLRDGIVFAANCEASAEQSAGFQENARKWREAVHAAIEGATDQPIDRQCGCGARAPIGDHCGHCGAPDPDVAAVKSDSVPAQEWRLKPGATADKVVVVDGGHDSYDFGPAACRYPACVENGPDGKCTDWLIGDCKGPQYKPDESP
jgi:hypothetical protein